MMKPVPTPPCRRSWGGICLPKKSLNRSSPPKGPFPKGLPSNDGMPASPFVVFSTWTLTTAGPTCSASVLKLSGTIRGAVLAACRPAVESSPTTSTIAMTHVNLNFRVIVRYLLV